MEATPGFEPGAHWWEACALTTAPATLAPPAPPLLRVVASCCAKFETGQTF